MYILVTDVYMILGISWHLSKNSLEQFLLLYCIYSVNSMRKLKDFLKPDIKHGIRATLRLPSFKPLP